MTNTYTVIASSFRSNLSLEHNLERHELAMETLIEMNMCDLKTCMGYYKEDINSQATREISIKVENLNYLEANKVCELFCKVFEQDCVLVITAQGKASLRHPTWSTQVGEWQQVDKATAKTSQAYTLDTNGNYWLAQ